MKNLPIELIATICEYLLAVDLFCILQLNKNFNFLWNNFEFWSLVYKGQTNLCFAILKELNDGLYDLVSLYLFDRDNHCFKLNDCNSSLNRINDIICDIQTNRCENFESYSVINSLFRREFIWRIWKIKMERNLKYMSFRQLISLFQDVEHYISDLKIVAIYSPVIAAINGSTLEIYQLENKMNIQSSYFDTNANFKETSKSIKITLNLISYIKFAESNDNNKMIEFNDLTAEDQVNIFKWIFYDTKTIFSITKRYGVYFYDIHNTKERFVLKNCITDDKRISVKINFSDLSGNLLVLGFEDGHLDVWKFYSLNTETKLNKTRQRLTIRLYCAINYEYTLIQQMRTSNPDDWSSPLTWVHISCNCNILLAIYKGIVSEVRVFSIKGLNMNKKTTLIRKISLSSDVQTCLVEPKGRFIVCSDSNKEIYPKTRLYSIKTGNLLLEFNFRFASLKFTPCGHFMIGAYRFNFDSSVAHQNNNSQSFRLRSNNLGITSINDNFISIWNIPSFKKIFTFNCEDSDRITNIHFSRTRNSTCIITTKINKRFDNEISFIETSSIIYFVSHDVFSQIKPNYITSFFSNEIFAHSEFYKDKYYGIKLIRENESINKTKAFFGSRKSRNTNLNCSISPKTSKQLELLSIDYNTVYYLFKKGFVPRELHSNLYSSTELIGYFTMNGSEIVNVDMDKIYLQIGSSRNKKSYSYTNNAEKTLLNELFID